MAIAYWNLILAGRFKFLDLWNTFLLVSFIITILTTYLLLEKWGIVAFY